MSDSGRELRDRPSPTATEAGFLVPAQSLEGYCLDHARRIGLGHWKIDFVVDPDLALDGVPCDGMCDWVTERHTCTISVSGKLDREETEWTIRHELVHLRLEGHKQDPSVEMYDPMYEFGINMITKAWS